MGVGEGVDRGLVGGRARQGAQVVWAHPTKRVMVEGLGLTQQAHGVTPKLNPLVLTHGDERADLGHSPKLLKKLAGEGLLVGLTRLDLAAGELPQTTVAAPRRAARHQHGAVGLPPGDAADHPKKRAQS